MHPALANGLASHHGKLEGFSFQDCQSIFLITDSYLLQSRLLLQICRKVILFLDVLFSDNDLVKGNSSFPEIFLQVGIILKERTQMCFQFIQFCLYQFVLCEQRCSRLYSLLKPFFDAFQNALKLFTLHLQDLKLFQQVCSFIFLCLNPFSVFLLLLFLLLSQSLDSLLQALYQFLFLSTLRLFCVQLLHYLIQKRSQSSCFGYQVIEGINLLVLIIDLCVQQAYLQEEYFVLLGQLVVRNPQRVVILLQILIILCHFLNYLLQSSILRQKIQYLLVVYHQLLVQFLVHVSHKRHILFQAICQFILDAAFTIIVLQECLLDPLTLSFLGLFPGLLILLITRTLRLSLFILQDQVKEGGAEKQRCFLWLRFSANGKCQRAFTRIRDQMFGTSRTQNDDVSYLLLVGCCSYDYGKVGVYCLLYLYKYIDQCLGLFAHDYRNLTSLFFRSKLNFINMICACYLIFNMAARVLYQTDTFLVQIYKRNWLVYKFGSLNSSFTINNNIYKDCAILIINSIRIYSFQHNPLMKKKVDSRIQTCLNNSTKTHERSLFIIVGDRARYQVVNFHYIMAKQNLRTKPSVLWCYKKELGFSTHQKKRMKEVKSMQTKGLYDTDIDDPFDLFISSTDIKYTYYKESHKVLGNTYQMLVLQDFEALTPNVLCRTIETVEGGGIIMILLKTMTSLKQLYTLTMDVHQRYRTDKFQEVEPRFNERFILSLSECKNAIFMDDELNILPISKHINEIQELPAAPSLNQKAVQELATLKTELQQKQIIGPLIQKSKTLDQAKALMVFINSVLNKTNKTTISLTAGRGRGKSAAVGLSVASAVAIGYSNIFVTAPSPQNLKTFFEFVIVGLETLGYKENMHFQKIESTNPDYAGCLIRINIFKDHHQFIQYVFPTDSDKISNSDLIVVDEAAAIPLPLVKAFLAYPLVFLSSTINGYEGTGRSLSLKLIQEIKEQSRKGRDQLAVTRSFQEIAMTDPIRYALNDPIQKWLADLLHLDATAAVPLRQGIPHPNDCELYLVNRDVLFSFKDKSQKFLHNLMSLFISSHYKNSPNDLQLMSDSPSHMLFVLLGPLKKNTEGKTELPDILCAIQLAIEGQIDKLHVEGSTERGIKPSGDLIPWNIRQQFQDVDFPRLVGGRVVRIATHPTLQKMGYGSRALQQLGLFFEGKLSNLVEGVDLIDYRFRSNGDIKQPLLKKADQIRAPGLDYLGTSYGVTKNLLKFWMKGGYEPVYIRQTKNDITAEHSCIMLKALHSESQQLNLCHYVEDFRRRFVQLLSFEFRKMDVALALDILNPNITAKQIDAESSEEVDPGRLKLQLTVLDLKRIEAYARNLSDFHLIVDLLPVLSKLFFCKEFGTLKLSYLQAAILIGLGLQHKNIDSVAKEFDLPVSQCLALFNKAIRKFYAIIKKIFEKPVESQMSEQKYYTTQAVGNRTLGLEQKGKSETERIMTLSDDKVDKINKQTRYNFALQDQDLKDVEVREGQKTVTIGRAFDQSRNEVVEKPKKKLKK